MTIASTTTAGQNSSTAASSTASSSASNPDAALSSLSGNLNNFLNLLMTQLQNQDPTSPMDTATFTSQLVQYASVEQQINANSNLQTLIQTTQSNMILGSTSLVGKQVNVTNSDLTLQNGQATVQFNATAAEPVDISVYNSAGALVLRTTANAQDGSNTWNWNGQDASGSQLPDGAYKVNVDQSNGNALTTTITGTVTGVVRNGSSVDVQMGALSSDISTIQSVNSAN